MRAKEELRRTLQRIDRKGYKAYKDVEDLYDFREYQLFIDRSGQEIIEPNTVIYI